MDKRTEKIIKDHAHDYRDMKLSEPDLEDLLNGVLMAINCEHDCSSNCRREGCNCDCGEYHYHAD